MKNNLNIGKLFSDDFLQSLAIRIQNNNSEIIEFLQSQNCTLMHSEEFYLNREIGYFIVTKEMQIDYRFGNEDDCLEIRFHKTLSDIITIKAKQTVTKIFDVIYINFPSKSFSWADGQYIIVKTDEEGHHICKLDEKLQPQLNEKGKFSISVTGVNNPGIQQTNLKYHHNTIE